MVELSKDVENPIGGLPFKAWEEAQQRQHKRNKSLKEPKEVSIDLQAPVSQQVMVDWKKQLRNGSESDRGSSPSRRGMHDTSIYSRALNETTQRTSQFGSGSKRAESRSRRLVNLHDVSKVSNDKLIPLVNFNLTSPRRNSPRK